MTKTSLTTFIIALCCQVTLALGNSASSNSPSSNSLSINQDSAPQLLLGEHQEPALLLNSKISGQVDGMVASITLIQEFENRSDNWINGRYVFPLPEGAVIDSLTLKNDDRVLRGVVKEKQEAKQIFEQAKKAGKKAGLVEQNRPNLFTMSLANIAPKSTVEAEINWVQKVSYEGGVFSLSLPTTLTPRYIPGKSLAINLSDLAEEATSDTVTLNGGWAVNTDQVPDASAITPPQISGSKLLDSHQVSIDLVLNAGLPLDKVSSSSHGITVNTQSQPYRIQFKNPSEPMDRDVLLQWQVAAQSIPKAAIFSEKKGDDYYNLIMINPPVKNIVTTLPKDVTFIIDTSGSMAGGSMEQAKSGLKRALGLLSEKDRFNIIEFNNVATQLFTDSHPVSQSNLHQAKRFIGSLAANGGTEMMNALQLAFAQPEHSEYLRQIIFITDGAVGNEKALFEFIHSRLNKARLFTVGIGSAPNTYFMQGAAKYGKGSSTHISNLVEVDSKMSRLFEKLTYPVMRDINAAWPEGTVVESYPTNLPDLYVAEPITMVAKTDKPLSNLTLSGQIAGESWQQTLTTQATGTATAKNLHKLWALDKVNSFEEASVLTGKPITDFKQEIVDVGIDNQIVTRYTSFVAVDELISRPEGQSAKDTKVPNLLPHAKKVFAPATATSAEINLLIGSVLLLLAIAYLWITRNRDTGGFVA